MIANENKSFFQAQTIEENLIIDKMLTETTSAKFRNKGDLYIIQIDNGKYFDQDVSICMHIVKEYGIQLNDVPPTGLSKTPMPSTGLVEERRYTVLVKDGKVYTCNELQPQYDRSKECLRFALDRDDMILALHARMNHCIDELQTRVNKQETSPEVFEKYSIIYYKEGGAFNTRAYEAMEQAIEMLKKMNSELFIQDLEKFSIIQLDQMMKATVSFHQTWTDSASCLSEIIYHKFQERR